MRSKRIDTSGKNFNPTNQPTNQPTKPINQTASKSTNQPQYSLNVIPEIYIPTQVLPPYNLKIKKKNPVATWQPDPWQQRRVWHKQFEEQLLWVQIHMLDLTSIISPYGSEHRWGSRIAYICTMNMLKMMKMRKIAFGGEIIIFYGY